MEKEFVPYELALRMKNFGFDEPTLYHWHNTSKETPFTNEIFNPNRRPMTNTGIKEIGEENHVWSAPTFSQAFRWFRETYGVMHRITSYAFGYQIHLDNTPDPTFWNTDFRFDSLVDYRIYEEAELACFEKMVEVIENKKEK